MSETMNDDVLTPPDELITLKARADMLGISYHPSIGVDKLREKVTAAMTTEEDKPKDSNPAISAGVDEVESPSAYRMRMKREANELIRIRVTCMNPAKKEWEGEYFTAGNAVVGSFTKFVPFNNDEGWYVPSIIYKQLVQRQCQIFVSTKDTRGNTTRKGKMIKEFAIEVLPNLTVEELQELAQRQAMAKSID